MLHTNKILEIDVRREEEAAVIPVASFDGKLLTVSSGGIYSVHHNGKQVCKTSSVWDVCG